MADREIKFRAWREKQKFMLTPHALVDLFTYGELTNPEAVIWLQYIGLKDKNSVEIYDGDIVSRGVMKQTLTVVPDAATGGFVFKNVDGSLYVFDVLRDYEYEVIGNIYENPELSTND